MTPHTQELKQRGQQVPPEPEGTSADLDDLIQELYFAMGFSVEPDVLRDRFPAEAKGYCEFVRRTSGRRLSDSTIFKRLIAVRRD